MIQQEKSIRVLGRFLEDSAKIGQDIHYVLRVSHAPQQEIFFPSINQAYGVFKPIKKDYFPTITNENNISVDSAVYTFKQFSIQDFQTLRIPVAIQTELDCTMVSPVLDTIYLKRLMPNAKEIKIDSLIQSIPVSPLKPKPDLRNLTLGAISMLIAMGLVYWLLGNRIRQGFKLYILWRKNLEFRRAYQRLMRNISNSSKGLQNLENAAALWKNYLERLTDIPFATFTTTEMVDNLPDKRLEKTLQEVDSAIYGGNFSTRTLEAINVLLEIAETVYLQERTKINQEVKRS
ncbi:MAG: hypothetical protein RL567_658 [Bacteroidota bacterium]|jgi:hypothetical protein